MKCQHRYPDGRECKAHAVKAGDGTRCNAHNGTLPALSKVGAAAYAAKARSRREAAEREQVLATMGLDARLRVEAAKREGELIQALLDLALVDRDRQALLAVFDRLEGRATQRVQSETVGNVSELESLSTEALRALLAKPQAPPAEPFPVHLIAGSNPANGLPPGVEPV